MNIDWDITKTILECITSICFLLGVWKGLLFFGYRNDESIRKLYIENSKKLEEIFAEFCQYDNVKPETFNKIYEAEREAELYLHKDIIDLIRKIKETLIDIDCFKSQLDNVTDRDERHKITEEIRLLSLKMSDLSKKRINKYRENIVNTGFVERFITIIKNIFRKLKFIIMTLLLFMLAGIVILCVISSNPLDSCLDSGYCKEGLPLNIERKKITVNKQTCLENDGKWIEDRKVCQFK